MCVGGHLGCDVAFVQSPKPDSSQSVTVPALGGFRSQTPPYPPFLGQWAAQAFLVRAGEERDSGYQACQPQLGQASRTPLRLTREPQILWRYFCTKAFTVGRTLMVSRLFGVSGNAGCWGPVKSIDWKTQI